MIADMHIHTKYSCDSREEPEEYCKQAAKDHVQAIGFTDHVDLNEADDGYGYYKPDKFFEDYNKMKEKYDKKLTVLAGIEFAEPHLYQRELIKYKEYPYDYIIGSIHYWYRDLFPSKMLEENIPVEICYEYYWEEVHKAVRAGGFHVFGHFDFPKRYYGRLLYDKHKMKNILSDMVGNNILLEINTSSIRKGFGESLPDKEILEIYAACGGKYITIGSDAHQAMDLCADRMYALRLCRQFHLQEVIIQNGVIRV